MPCLISSGGHVYEFDGFPSRFGTAPNCEIHVQSGEGIGGHHFTILKEGSRTILVVRNGQVTKVNGSEVRRAIIADGDIIDAGDLQLTYSDPNAQFGADLPTGPKRTGLSGGNQFQAPLELEPFPMAVVAHTPTPVGQQGPFVPQQVPAAIDPPQSKPMPGALALDPLAAPDTLQAPTQVIKPVPMVAPQSNVTPSQALATPAETRETVDFDWAAASEEEQQADEDLAKFFRQDPNEEKQANKSNPELTVPPVIEGLELPDIPNIADAEESGNAVQSNEAHSNNIDPIASKTMRRPNVPRAKRNVSSIKPITPQESDLESCDSGKGAKRKRSWRKRKTLEQRMLESRGPKCRQLIPWHKVAVLIVILFGAAGAWLATEGQHVAAQIMHRLGIQAEADHKKYLEHFVTTDPVLLLTLDADAWISFYRECASDLNSLTVSQLNTVLKQTTSAFEVDDIDRLTIAIDRRGQMLALVSVKEALNKRRLLYDLSRGMSIPEKLPNNITLHSGLIGRSQPILFAMLNEKTFAIGEPSALQEFLSSDGTPLALAGQNQQLLELARSSTDSLGLYIKPQALLAIRSKAPVNLHPYIDKLATAVAFPNDFELIAQISSYVSVSGDGNFDTAANAQAFATSLPTLIDEQFQRVASMLGTETATIDGIRAEFDQMRSTSTDNRAQFSVKAPNRWLGTELQHLQETVQMVASEIRSSKRDKADYTQQPDLLSPEDFKMRVLAKNVASEYVSASRKGAPKLKGLKDIDKIIKVLAQGVRGGGIYKKVKFQVKGIADQPTVNQVAKLLAWKEDRLVFSPYKAHEPAKVVSSVSEGDDA